MEKFKYTWIGLIVSLVTVVFVVGLLYLQDISLQKSNYSFTVLFDNVQGLHEGDDVTMLGKRVGKVSKTMIFESKIAVELSIDNSFAFSIPIDSKIEVKSEGLIGTKYVSITPGINTKTFISAGQSLEGTKEYDFSEITPGIVPLTQDLGVFARRLKATLGEEQKDDIRSTIKNIESLTNQIDSYAINYSEIISNEDKEDIKKTIQSLEKTSSNLNKIVSKDFSKAIDNVNKVANNFSDISKQLGDFSEKINDNSTISKLLHEDDELYQESLGLIKDLRKLTNDLQSNPTKYMKAYWKGKK